MIIKTIFVLAFYLLFFAIAEILFKKGFEAKTTRKVVHIGGALVTFFLPYLISLSVAIGIGFVFTLLLVLTKKKHLLCSVHAIGEDNIGAIIFPVGLISSAILFWPHHPIIFQGSALLTGFSDGFAGIFGQKFGKRHYSVTGPKTLEGSLVFFVITFCIMFFLSYLNHKTDQQWQLLYFIAGSLVITVIEGFSGKGWDNLFVPILGGFILQLIL